MRAMSPKIGVLDFNPIQYRVPLYRRLAQRGRIDLDVLYLSDRGYRASIDPGFGIPVAWNIDLTSGYPHSFLDTAGRSRISSKRARFLTRWLTGHDAVIIHGYSNPWMLAAIAACRSRKVPYLLRGESHPEGRTHGVSRYVRHSIARIAVSHSAGGLAIGQLNEAFYRKYRAPSIIFAPYSVDDERFARAPEFQRSRLLHAYGLDDSLPVIIFSGKLIPRKRPFDLVAALEILPREVNALFVGDGSLAERIRGSAKPGRSVVTGFVNQAELPAYYHAADILVLPSEDEPWGLVVNEAMAAGVLPVVSHQVGCASDLVRGLGQIYPCGNVAGLANALGQALATVNDPQIRCVVKRRAAPYGLECTAKGYEQAALALAEACG